MTNRTKRQHIVPRFYLSRFCNGKGMVWTYSAGKEPMALKPEDTAIETNFYSPIDKDGERFDDAENVLAKIEAAAAPLWEEMIAGRVMKGKAREDFSLFLAAQFLRSPAAIGAGAQMAALWVNHYVKMHFAHAPGTDDTKSTEDGDFREIVRDPSKYKINVLREVGLPMLGGIEKLADVFLNMKWIVGRSKDHHLITSDSPVTRTSDPRTHHPSYGDAGFVNGTVRVELPLSADRMLQLSWGTGERERIVEIPKRMAREMNGVRAVHAERFLYANQRDSGIQKLCDKWLGRERKPTVTTGPHDPVIKVERKLE